MYENRQYKIGEFAAMTGMTPSKIRFYEKAGLFTEHRQENGYRCFTPNDAFRANAFRVLLQYGFTVEQAIAMIDARQQTTDFEQSLVTQHNHLLEQVDILRHRLVRIENALDLLRPEPGPTFEIVDVDDQLFMRASHEDDFAVSAENERELALFYNLFDYASCARIIARDDFSTKDPLVHPSYIICLPISEAHRIESCDETKVEALIMGKCLRVRRILTREESVRKETFEPVFDYLEQHGYHLRGDILLLPAFLNLDGQGSDIETLLVPIG